MRRRQSSRGSTIPTAPLILAHPLPPPRGHGRLFEHVVVCRDDERVRIGLDQALPPRERRPRDRPGRIAPSRSPPDRRPAVVAIPHHQEQEIPHAERIPLPRALDGIGPALRMDAGVLRVFAGRVHPLAKPPLARLIGPARIVVADQIVEVLPRMPAGSGELPHHFLPFLVFRRRLASREVAEMQRNIPVEGRPALTAPLFRLPNCLRETLPSALAEVRAHVGTARGPETKRSTHGYENPPE